MQVVSFRDVDASSWDAFVEAHADGTFFHRYGWNRVLEEAMGHRSESLALVDQGALKGILPLTHIRSRLFGQTLVSQAFCVRGGPLTVDEAATTQLIEAAVARANALGVKELEVRATVPATADWIGEETYFNFSRELSSDEDENMKAIPRKQRAMVRKGIQAGLEAAVSTDVDSFYPIYADSVHRLGTPVFPKRWFEALMREFAGDCDITLSQHNGQTVAAVMSFYHHGTVLPYYGGGLPAARAVKGYDFMYWALMSRAAANGCQRFDFGRSKAGTGPFSFKKNWGFTPEPLGYRYKLIRATEHHLKNPDSPRYRRVVEIWKRLPPFVVNRLGPLIARDLG